MNLFIHNIIDIKQKPNAGAARTYTFFRYLFIVWRHKNIDNNINIVKNIELNIDSFVNLPSLLSFSILTAHRKPYGSTYVYAKMPMHKTPPTFTPYFAYRYATNYFHFEAKLVWTQIIHFGSYRVLDQKERAGNRSCPKAAVYHYYNC